MKSQVISEEGSCQHFDLFVVGSKFDLPCP